MSEGKTKIFLGLTGSFGSGCTALMKGLEKMGFKGFSLSKYVKEEWKKKNPKKPLEVATREELQDVGNELRQKHGTSYLAKKAIEEATNEIKERSSIVFDSIRNLGEIGEFRSRFPVFFLIAVDCKTTLRWQRVKPTYDRLGLTEHHFQMDDVRDKFEEGIDYGQQVELCVDAADILICNNENYPDENVAVDKLKLRMEDYIDLMTDHRKRGPTPAESYMNMAYTAASNSNCIKRRVGAVIVDEKNESILSSGYNEVPKPAEPCTLKYAGRCYRDIYKAKYFKDLEEKGQECPKCGKKLKNIVYPFHCECDFDLDKYFIRDKALNRCRALHAEEKAILSLDRKNAEALTLYTTTFPCFSCAKIILHSGIKNIVYVQPYPDEESIEVLGEVEIAAKKFEGVKARAYFRFFGG